MYHFVSPKTIFLISDRGLRVCLHFIFVVERLHVASVGQRNRIGQIISANLDAMGFLQFISILVAFDQLFTKKKKKPLHEPWIASWYWIWTHYNLTPWPWCRVLKIFLANEPHLNISFAYQCSHSTMTATKCNKKSLTTDLAAFTSIKPSPCALQTTSHTLQIINCCNRKMPKIKLQPTIKMCLLGNSATMHRP